MREIYADFNNFDHNDQLPLNCKGSIESINQLIESLKDGEEVWLFDGEMRAKAQVFHHEDGTWVARSSNWDFISV